jgi:hypothetical protein
MSGTVGRASVATVAADRRAPDPAAVLRRGLWSSLSGAGLLAVGIQVLILGGDASYGRELIGGAVLVAVVGVGLAFWRRRSEVARAERVYGTDWRSLSTSARTAIWLQSQIDQTTVVSANRSYIITPPMVRPLFPPSDASNVYSPPDLR